jgi:predicted AAA+ superfamily ATPase
VPFFPEAEIDAVLRAQNAWWATGTLPRRVGQTPPRPQDDRLVANERPLLMVGPRRSGKTATLFRLLEGQLRAGRRPKDIAYVPLDHPLLRLIPLGPLVDQALRIMEPDARPLVLLDGLQTLPDWPERFEELVETRPHPRIVASASVAPGSEDPPYDVLPVGPLRFPEFCAVKGLPDLGAPALELLEPQLPEADPADDYLFDRVLDPILADYLVRGGFPEAVFEPDLTAAHQVVRDGVVAGAVYRDLPGVVGVAKLADLERVLLATQLHGIAPLQIEAFADAVELDRQTVVRYLEHLQRAFLVTSLKNFAASTDRSRPRVFPIDPALPNALLERGAALLATPKTRRELLVGAVVSHVREAAHVRGFDIAYFRDGDLEADVVVVTPSGVVPIVVVDREEVDEDDAVRVERVMKRTQAKSAFLLSRARPRRKTPVSFFESVYHMPAAYFLYALRS